MWQTYKGDGSKGPFTFTFGADNVNQVLCIVSTGYGDMTLNGADFSVTLNKDQDNNPGGIVMLDQILPVGHYLTVGLVGQIVQTPNSVERRKGARSDVVCRHLKSIEDQYRESVFKTEKIYTDCADKLDEFTESEKKVITDKLDQVNSDIDSMKTESEGRLSALESSVTNTENNINQQIENTKANVDNKLLVIKQAIEVNGQNIQKNKENIAVNDTAIKANLATIESHTNSLSSLDGRVTTNESDIDSLEERATTLESTASDHETRIIANKKVIDNHELRLNNIETSTDVGQFATRLQAIEDKNTEQDASIGANATAITTESKAREDADNALGVRIDNADAKNTEQDTKLGTIDTHLGTIDTHLETIDEKNTAQDTALASLSQNLQANYVTLTTGQDIFAGKTFAGDDTATLNLRSNVVDLDNPASINLNGKTLFFSDKKNKNIGSVYSGVYNGTDFDGVFTRLQVRNEKSTGENNTPYLEVQARNSGLNAAYAPSNISHSYLTEIATVDWVYQRGILPNNTDVNYFKLANNLVITIFGGVTLTDSLLTLTYPIPYKYTPAIHVDYIGISAGDNRNFNIAILNPTPTSVQLGGIVDGRYLPLGIYVLAVGVIN